MGKQTSVREKRWLDGITESTDMSLSKLADGEGQRKVLKVQNTQVNVSKWDSGQRGFAS